MSVPPPPQPAFNQRGTMTTSPSAGTGTSGFTPPTFLPTAGGGNQGYAGGSGPEGYRQNVSGSASYEPTSYQRGGEEEEEGFLGSAVRFAKGAGERLAKAESEVWKRINGEGGK